MANKYYAPGAQRAARVQDLFGAIAPRYDLINDLQSFGLHRFWKRRLIQLARLQPGERALDLCCGSGDVALAMARSGACVFGLDFSAAMLSVAQQRCRKFAGQLLRPSAPPSPSDLRPPISIQFLRGDALNIPLVDAQFDVVTISYGLRNLANLDRGLAEMARVAKPGGRLLVLDFGKPENWLWRRFYFAYLNCWVPLFGRVFCGDSETYSYILKSLQHYPAQRGVAAKMRELKFRQVRFVNLLGGVMSINYGEKP